MGVVETSTSCVRAYGFAASCCEHDLQPVRLSRDRRARGARPRSPGGGRGDVPAGVPGLWGDLDSGALSAPAADPRRPGRWHGGRDPVQAPVVLRRAAVQAGHVRGVDHRGAGSASHWWPRWSSRGGRSARPRAHGVSWWMVQTAVTAAVLKLPAVDDRCVGLFRCDRRRGALPLHGAVAHGIPARPGTAGSPPVVGGDGRAGDLRDLDVAAGERR